MDFNAFWEFCRKLKSAELATIGERSKFVFEFDGDGFKYIVMTGKIRKHKKKYVKEIFDIYQELGEGDRYKPAAYGEHSMHGSYALALLKRYVESLEGNPSEASINHHERAANAWPILTKYAEDGRTITYGQLAQLIGVHHRALRYLLDPIQNYCLIEGLPPLTILVVNQAGVPGQGFIAWKAESDFDGGLRKAFNFNWGSIDNPFSFASDGTSAGDIVEKILALPEDAEENFSRIRSRGVGQPLFRKALLKVYKRRCAITGLSFEEALDAIHIVPWSECEPRDRFNIKNGLLLSKLHHKLFDEGYITLSDDYRIVYYDPQMQKRAYTQYDKSIIGDLHGKKISLPDNQSHHPGEKFIKVHNHSFKGELG